MRLKTNLSRFLKPGLPWFGLYACAVSAWAYWCSRGSDGRLKATLIGFGFLGLVYWVTMFYGKRAGVVTSLKHLAILEFAAIAALVIHPQLEEMGGSLNALIPVLVLAIVAGGALVRLLRPIRLHE